MDIKEVRQRYPQYSDLSDDQLLGSLHSKYYSDIPLDEFKSKFSPNNKPSVNEPPKTEKTYPGQQYIEPALSMASSAIAEPLAGLSGLVTLPFAGNDAAVGVTDIVRDQFTYQPRSQEGQENLNAVGDFVRPVMEPISKALDFYGSGVAEMTGSPLAGSLTKGGMAILPELLGLRGLQGARRGVPLLENNQPTQQLEGLLNKRGLTYDGLTPESKALVPNNAPPGLLPSPKSESNWIGGLLEKTQIASGGRDEALARIMLEGDRVVKDKQAIDAIKNGWRESTVMLSKGANDATKKAMNEMLTKRWALLKNDSLDFEPMSVVGDAFYDRVKFISDKATQARADLDTIAKSPKFRNARIDPKPILQVMKGKLDDLNIRYTYENGQLNLDFTDSVIAANKKSQKAISDVLKLIKPDRANTAHSVHLLKRQLDDLIDFKKQSKGGISEEGRNFLKALRHETNQVLGNSIDDYAQVNDIMHRSLTALEDFSGSANIKLNYFDDPSDAIGRKLMRLHTNYASRDAIKQSAKRIDDLAAEFGGDFQTNYDDLAKFANRLDERFGSSRSGDFQSKLESANKSILSRMGLSYATEGTAGAAREGLSASQGLLKRFGGKDDYDAYQSLKGLLNR